MDPRDIDFAIQSGNAGQGPVDWDNAYSMMAIAAFFMERATLAAGRYVEACGRNEITGKDMIVCLKYTALPSSNFWQTENLLEHVRQWKERLLADESDDEEEEEITASPIAAAMSDDEFDNAITSAEQQFENWEPADDIGIAVHRAIRRAELTLLAQELD